jgi:hypothetical protein
VPSPAWTLRVKNAVPDEFRRDKLSSRSEWRGSSTGFPFRVVDLAGTLAQAEVREVRSVVCDLGHLGSARR